MTVDGVVVRGGEVLLVRRKNPPFQGCWALPGGFVDVGETCEAACVREVREETGLSVRIMRLVGVYSDPARDPRRHTVTVAFRCEVVGGALAGGDDAAAAQFFPLTALPKLAFNHKKIVEDSIP